MGFFDKIKAGLEKTRRQMGGVFAEFTGENEEFFDDILRKQKVKKRRNVFIMTIDGNGKIYLQCYGGNYRAFRAPLPEGISW